MLDEPWQTEAFPEIVPCMAGIVVTVTLKVCADEEPHGLLAVTEIVPPEDPDVVVMLVVVDVPDQPDGNVHV